MFKISVFVFIATVINAAPQQIDMPKALEELENGSIFKAPTTTITEAKSNAQCSSDFGYHVSDGPLNWKDFCPQCGGKQQSPICIDPKTVVHDPNLIGTEFINYDLELENVTAQNSGHSLKLQIPPGPDTRIGVVLPHRPDDIFILKQIHLHWGTDNKEGSEHCIGKRNFYPMEIHVVHEKEDTKERVAFGIFAQISCTKENSVITAMGQAGKTLAKSGGMGATTILTSAFKMTDLLPSESEFFSYHGSLTIPPCPENIDWIVFEEPLQVQQETLDILRQLRDTHEHLMNENHRPPQPLHGRKVRYSGSSSPQPSRVPPEFCN